MSDCSMAAMKPKMPPKTCGTCDSFVLAKGCDHLGICSEVYFEDEHGDDAFAAVRDTRACDNPSLYKPRMADCESCPERIPEDACRVKARCYDLQEAAREMVYALQIIERTGVPPSKRTVDFHVGRLAELGGEPG